MGKHNQNILLFGGTFNPIHHGHLRIALEAYQQLAIDEVWFIPNYQPPHKAALSVAAEHRLAMLELSIRPYPFMKISRVEINNHAPSYTIETVRHLTEHFSDHTFYWLTGQDSFNSLTEWEGWRELLDTLNWAIVPRPGIPAAYPEALANLISTKQMIRTMLLEDGHEQDQTEMAHCSSTSPQSDPPNAANRGNIYLLSTTRLDISSTHIRELSSKQQPCDFLVTADVNRYLADHKLYQA